MAVAELAHFLQKGLTSSSSLFDLFHKEMPESGEGNTRVKCSPMAPRLIDSFITREIITALTQSSDSF